MTQKSHDHNFKNLLLDFPEESLKLFFPAALERWGKVLDIEFVRQEPGKHKLTDPGLELDMPILFAFEKQVVLWLIEFQEEKSRFSIYKLLHYTTDMMESYPQAVVIPTVLFTKRSKWRKDVFRKIESKIKDRLLLHFEYVFIKLFDFNARDYYSVKNPVAKILLPKMNYEKHERQEVIRQAYMGLYQFASRILFEKYVDFIDVYAQIKPDEKDSLYNEIVQHKETAMLAQYIRDKGKQEGIQEGIQKGIRKGIRESIIDTLQIRFGKISSEIIDKVNQFDDPVKLKKLHGKAIQIKEMDAAILFA